MVNLGPSKGCQTCKARRIKCDQGEPECQRCLRSRRVCGGYAKKPKAFRFKNEIAKVIAGDAQKDVPRHDIQHIAPSEEHLAVCFFVKNFATLGRDLASTRGFWELIPPILSSETSDSPLTLAITAVAMRLWHLWSTGSKGVDEPDVVQMHSSRALKRLVQAVNNPVESNKTATVLASMALHLGENISALRSPHKPTRAHHEGAMALAKHQAANTGTVTSGNYALSHILFTEVIFAIREHRPAAPELIDQVVARGIAAQSVSVKLNLIGASIATLQWRLSLSATDVSSDQALLDIYFDAQSIQAELLSWRDWVPSEWHPARIDQVKQAEPPIITYREHCDVYWSVQIASLWANWRCYYLALLRVIIATDPLRMDDTCFPEQELSCIQELVDQICDSIPFFLGNCGWKLSLADVTNPAIQFPSIHDLNPDARLRPWCGPRTNSMSHDEHTRHVLAQGAWHILTPLHHLLEILSDGEELGLGSFLRPGQHEWIREQVARAQTMIYAKRG